MIQCFDCRVKVKSASAGCITKCKKHPYIFLCDNCNDNHIENDEPLYLDKAAKKHKCFTNGHSHLNGLL